MHRSSLLRRATLVILTFLCAWTFNLPSARAESETWQIKSSHPYTVQLEFYSKARNAAWPGGGKAYLLDNSKMHTFTLNCQRGEKICYGAWDVGRGTPTWGVGKDEARGCSDCCYTCGMKGEPRSINLIR